MCLNRYLLRSTFTFFRDFSDSFEREKAIELLQDCKEHIVLPLIGEEPIAIQVEGLEVMNDDPSDVDVIYAKVKAKDGSDKLQTLADKLVEKFVSAGLMVKQYDRVKLHLTLINSLFRKDDAGICDNEIGQKKRDGRRGEDRPLIRESLDAQPILELHGSRMFCETSISEIHLSQRRAGRKTEKGYYWPSTVLNIQSCG